MSLQRYLTILQYNVQKSKDNVLMPLLEDPSIQEPWKNPFLQTSYNPSTSNFSLAYMPHPDTRVAFYINKQIDTSSWEVDFISPDLIHLKLSLTDDLRTRMVHIFNI